MARSKVLSLDFENIDEYRKHYMVQKYKSNPEYMAQSKLKYYKRIYKDDANFQIIINEDKSNSDLLIDVIVFHQKIKLGI